MSEVAPPTAAELPAKSSKWTSFLIASGFFATVFGVAGTLAESWLADDRQEVCAHAHAAMLDDRLNTDVPPALRRRYLQKQAQIAIRCAQLGEPL